MLDRLLEVLGGRGSHRLTDLAQALDTTPAMVEMMLDSLARMGYVKPIEAACGDACDKCSMSGSCGAGLGGRVWVLTEKSRGVDRSVGGER